MAEPKLMFGSTAITKDVALELIDYLATARSHANWNKERGIEILDDIEQELIDFTEEDTIKLSNSSDPLDHLGPHIVWGEYAEVAQWTGFIRSDLEADPIETGLDVRSIEYEVLGCKTCGVAIRVQG